MSIIRRTIVLSIIPILGMLILLASSVFAQDNKSRLAEYNLKDNDLAIQGYDVVSYFMGEPLKGKENLTYTFNGAVYWFNSEENIGLFKRQPEKFEPAYGGWCAYAMGINGEKVKIDPKTYKIIEGQLFLFYNFYFNNTLIDWNKDEQVLKRTADQYWEEIIHKP